MSFCFTAWMSKTFGKFTGKLSLPMKSYAPTERELSFFRGNKNYILLTRRDKIFSNLFIKGYWKHVARSTDYGVIVEAISKGVTKRSVFERLRASSDYVVIRTKFTDKTDEVAVSDEIEDYIGEKYDWEYQGDNDDLYCSELIWQGYMDAIGEFPIGPRRVGCQDIILPNAFDNSKYFELIVSSETLRDTL